MTRTLTGAVVLAIALPLSACGLWPGGDNADDPGASVDSTAVAVADSAPGVDQAALVVPPAVAQSGGVDATTPDLLPDSLTTDERLEALTRSQAEMSRQVDSLLTLLAAASPVPASAGSPSGVLGSPAQGAATDSAGALAAGGEVLGQARDQVRGFGVGVFGSVLVIIVFNLLIRVLVWTLDRLSERSAKRRLFYKRLVPIVRIVLWIFAAYLIVSVIFQVDYQGIVAAAAAVGVAIGFAAQDLLKNLFGGLILVFDQPFQVGDKISVGETYGEVVSIGLRSTRLVTADDNLVSVPNAMVVDQQVANANAGELNCQVVTDVYLPGWVDEARAKRIAFEAASSSKYVFLNKPIVVLVKDEFKETFLTRVRVKAYVLDPRFEFLFQSDVTERARAGFRAAGLLRPEQVIRGYVDVGAGTTSSAPNGEEAVGET